MWLLVLHTCRLDALCILGLLAGLLLGGCRPQSASPERVATAVTPNVPTPTTVAVVPTFTATVAVPTPTSTPMLSPTPTVSASGPEVPSVDIQRTDDAQKGVVGRGGREADLTVYPLEATGDPGRRPLYLDGHYRQRSTK